ncbi:MAG: hypothetical protein OHK0056_13330 [Bacteriovoracaceae bacterium]
MRYGSLLVILTLLFVSSCAEVRIHSRGKIPVWVGPKPGHNNVVEKEGVKQFFLWGLVPEVHEINLDEEFGDTGMISAANVTVEVEQSWSSLIKEILSLGLYNPRDYKVRGFGLKPDDAL